MLLCLVQLILIYPAREIKCNEATLISSYIKPGTIKTRRHILLARECFKLAPCMLFIGASLSEPHIDELAVNFPYIYIFLSYVVP